MTPCRTAGRSTSSHVSRRSGIRPCSSMALLKGAEWLCSRQATRVADWKISAPDAEPGGWYFQFENEWYPDVDDSAVVVMALQKVRPADIQRYQAAIARAYRWILA